MNITFDRVASIKQAYDEGKKATEELQKTALDYFMCNAITVEEKEELLAYMQPQV